MHIIQDANGRAFHQAVSSHRSFCEDMNQFTILSSNIESIHYKINIIQAYVDSYRSNDFEFDALCFQECWLSDESTNYIQSDGYHCIYRGKSCSGKGGLMIYIRNIYNYDIRKSIKASEIWEGKCY